jgi:hypothetical protein
MTNFNQKERQTLSEIYRRLHTFKVDGKCNMEKQLLLLAVPHEAKGLIGKDIIKPSKGIELPRVNNWYKLTTKGKELFKKYLDDKPSEAELLGLFTGNLIKSVD